MDKEKNLNKIHSESAKYLHEKWRENRRLYEEQLKTGKDYGIYVFCTKNKHQKFKDFEPLDLERYLKDWEMEHGDNDE